MKYHYLLLLLIISIVSRAQQINVDVDWKSPDRLISHSGGLKIPSFDNGFIHESGQIKFSKNFPTNGIIDPLSAKVINVVSEPISAGELFDLDQDFIENSLGMSLINALSRKRNYLQLQFNPIIKQADSYRRITSLTVGYEFAQSSTPAKNTGLTDSKIATGDWYRFKVEKTGVHRLTPAFLRSLGMDLSNVDPRTIKVYGQGGTSLPLINQENRFYDPAEIAITVTGEGDGELDTNDAILFYGVATDTEYVEENDSFINPYSDDSYYYITAGGPVGKRITVQQDQAVPPNITFDYYLSTKFHEIDERNIGALGRIWYGERFLIEAEQTFEFEFDNIITSRPATIQITSGAISELNTAMSYTINGQPLGSSNYRGLADDSNSLARRANFVNNNLTLNDNKVNVKLSYDNGGNPSAQGFLDYIRIDAFETLTGTGEQFPFTVPQAAQLQGVGQYIFKNSSSITEVWDITDRFNSTKFINEDSSDNYSFTSSLGQSRKYLVVDPSDYYSPIKPARSKVANQNIKGTIFNDEQGNFQDIDYLIIAPDFLKGQAQRLADYHRVESNLITKVVVLEDIYTEFSEGREDISAIRNFVKYVYDNASSREQAVQFLNLFGDTSYDYKGRIPIKDNVVPSFLSANSTSRVNSYMTDDFFTFMDPMEGDVATNNLMDLAVGRMIVSNSRQAIEMVDKVESYTAAPSFDRWRNNVTLIGDDVDIPGDAILQKSVNQLGDDIFNNRPDYNVRKILLDSYNQVSSAGGPRYPEAVDDIINAFEQGSLVVNYFGHGNEDGLAQEFVITQSLVENLRNPNTLPLFIAVTCEFSRFDNPQRVSGGELIYLNPMGGAIALVATNRLIFINVGVTLNDTLDDYLFGLDFDEPISMAEALRLAKVDPSLASNGTRRVVTFVGDPALKLAFPSPKVVLTQVNGQPIQSATNLRALDRVSLSGQVQSITGTLMANFNGIVDVTLYDKEIERVTLGNDNTIINGQLEQIEFKQQGEILFRGKATVENGIFTVNFIMPRDTQIPLGNGRVSFYAKKSDLSEDFNGYSQQLVIGGINENAPKDDVGPEIELFLNDRNFVSGGITDSNPFILAFLEDMSGINTASGIGHDIIGIIDGDETNPFVLNDYYESDLNDFTKGKVYFPLRDIAPGLHTLTFKSWDTYNNSSTQEIQFVVASGEGIQLTRVLNYPNPFNSYTEFWFNHDRPFEPLEVQVQVMTITGKVVWSTNQIVTTTGFTSREITWNGVDDFGQRLGKGVYLYKITVKSTLSDDIASKIEKLVIL